MQSDSTKTIVRVVFGLILVYGVIGIVILLISLVGSPGTSALLFAEPTATQVPPTATQVPPTATQVPPTTVPTKTKIPPTVKPTANSAKSVCYAQVQDWANDTGYLMITVWASFKAFENNDLVGYGDYLYKAKLEYDAITAPRCDSDVVLAHDLIGSMLTDMANVFFAINEGRVYDAAISLKSANSTLKNVTQIINSVKLKYDIQ